MRLRWPTPCFDNPGHPFKLPGGISSMENAAQLVQLGMQHHLAGRLGEAQALYQQVLRQDPQQDSALHAMAVIEHQAGRREAALALVDRAIAAKSNIHDYHNTRADICRVMGKLDEALA